jgi:hypothetical protein
MIDSSPSSCSRLIIIQNLLQFQNNISRAAAFIDHDERLRILTLA